MHLLRFQGRDTAASDQTIQEESNVTVPRNRVVTVSRSLALATRDDVVRGLLACCAADAAVSEAGQIEPGE